jgi:triosephosphate isomerase
MRKPLIAGNWKMYKDIQETKTFFDAFVPLVSPVKEVDMAICPSFVNLSMAIEGVKDSEVKIGAQNCYYLEEGAYTGEIAPHMLKNMGCTYCIIGHSERRQYFHDTNSLVNQKAKALLKAGVTPILCVGETLEAREKGETFSLIKTQVLEGFVELSQEEALKTVVAYEPVWAIGTGKVATNEQAQEVVGFIRNVLKEMFGFEISETMRILYGGSVKPDNIKGLMAEPDIDGALVGGASLKPQDFAAIISNTLN